MSWPTFEAEERGSHFASILHGKPGIFGARMVFSKLRIALDDGIGDVGVLDGTFSWKLKIGILK